MYKASFKSWLETVENKEEALTWIREEFKTENEEKPQ